MNEKTQDTLYIPCPSRWLEEGTGPDRPKVEEDAPSTAFGNGLIVGLILGSGFAVMAAALIAEFILH